MALDIARIKAVLFDIDGTLSDSDDQMMQRAQKILYPLRFMATEKQRFKFARWLVMTVESPGNFIYNLADRADLDSLFIKILEWRNQNRSHPIKKYWLVPGVEGMLKVLSGKLLLGVVSARDERSSRAFIDQHNLSKTFKVVVTSQTVRHTKPFPDPMIYAAEALRVAPENCLMVGDTTVDMRSAKLAGMQAAGVLCGFGRQKELLRAGADVLLDTTADLVDVLGIR
jgi:phosphoglycolate phosphatase-like HAD superfamily hydrolase